MSNRNIKYTFRLNESESKIFKNRVKKSGLSQESYFRHLINGLVPTEKPTPDFFAMMKELHFIGVTLRQIRQDAHILNAPDVQRLDEALAFHNKAVVFIMNAVMLPRKIKYNPQKM